MFIDDVCVYMDCFCKTRLLCMLRLRFCVCMYVCMYVCVCVFVCVAIQMYQDAKRRNMSYLRENPLKYGLTQTLNPESSKV